MKRGLVFIGLFLLLIMIFSASASIFHGPGNISISIDGVSRTLRERAITLFGEESYFTGIGYIYTLLAPVSPGHAADQIWVYVKDGETTLFNALNSSQFKNRLCPNVNKPTTYKFSPVDKSKSYHYATEVWYKEPVYALGVLITPGISLQGAINNGEFAAKYYNSSCFSSDLYWNDSCGNIGSKKQDCGDNGCDAWGAKYASGSYYYQKRTCHTRGCNSTAIACFDNTYTETKAAGTVSTGGHGGDKPSAPAPGYGGLPNRVA